jgi:hypothetical protein
VAWCSGGRVRAYGLAQRGADSGFGVGFDGRERVVEHQQPGLVADAANARAKAMRCRWRPETRMPSSPMPKVVSVSQRYPGPDLRQCWVNNRSR